MTMMMVMIIALLRMKTMNMLTSILMVNGMSMMTVTMMLMLVMPPMMQQNQLTFHTKSLVLRFKTMGRKLMELREVQII